MGKLLGRIADFFRETDKIIFLLSTFAALYGSILVWSAGSRRQFFVQLAAIAAGTIFAVIISLFDYETFGKRWYIIVAAVMIPVALTFFIGYAPDGIGSKSWIRLPGGMSLQPSEFLKLAFIITFAKHVSFLEDKVSTPLNVLLLGIHGAIPIGIIMVQGDDGSALVVAGIFAGMMVAAGIKWRYFIGVGVLAGIALPVAYFAKLFKPYQISRIMVLFNPGSDPNGVEFQQRHAKYAFANGKFFGTGLFKGPEVQSRSLPEAYNDFIYAACGEELGLMGCLAILLLLIAICVRILRVASLSKDRFGMIICAGVFSMIAVQTVINVGMCLSLLPVIGITLPFFTAGGTSILCVFMGVGMVASVYSNRGKRTLYLKDL